MIPFTQFTPPDGRKSEGGFERPAEIEKKAYQLADEGYKFEIELLSDSHMVNMDCSHPADDEPVAMELCQNGPGVVEFVDKLVNKAHQRVFSGGENA